MTDYVLDTSALLTLLKDEDGAVEVENVLEACEAGRSRAYLPFMSMMELEYLVLRSNGRATVEHVLRILQAWPVERVESNPQWGRKAAAVKKQGGLSMADAWISSLALMLDAEIVHKDPELDARSAGSEPGAGLNPVVVDVLAERVTPVTNHTPTPLDAELVHKDPELDALQGLKHRRLPYKRS